MTDEMAALARRAVACKGWKWMPGMLGWRTDNHGVPHSIRFVKGVESMEALAGVGTGPLVASGYATCDGYWRSDDVTLDLTDPATLGCLSDLVTEAYADPKKLWNGYVEVHRDVLDVFCLEQAARDEDGDLVWNCICSGETEVEVLVRALEIAP